MGEKKAVGIDYAKLEADLLAAVEAAGKVRHIKGDGGLANGDSVTLRLPRAVLGRLQDIGERAKVSVFKRYAGAFMVSTPHGDGFQDYEKTARAQAMVDVLRARGWDASLHFFTD